MKIKHFTKKEKKESFQCKYWKIPSGNTFHWNKIKTKNKLLQTNICLLCYFFFILVILCHSHFRTEQLMNLWALAQLR